MKKLSFFLMALTVVVVSCNKTDVPQSASGEPQEIILSVDGSGIEAEVTTKTSVVSSLPSTLYFAGTTGSNSSQGNKWSSTSKSVSSGKISTGYYQTETPTSYNYYLSNLSMTSGGTGCTISADGTLTDAIAGVAKSTASTSPSVSMEHIFARTGSVTGSCTNYTVSNLSVSIQSTSGTGYKGTYNIYSGTWSSVTGLSSTTITSASDRYLIPGTYTITASATISRGDYSGTVSGSTNITLTKGKINDIAVKFSADPAQPINVSVSLAAWSNQTVNATIAG